MELFLNPVTVFALLVGGMVGWYPRWPILRVLTLAFVPLVIAVICTIFYGELGLFLVPMGAVAYGLGMLIGHLLQRIQKSHHDT